MLSNLDVFDLIRTAPALENETILTIKERFPKRLIFGEEDAIKTAITPFDGVFLKYPKLDSQITEGFNQPFGGLAHHLADCKNLEMLGAHFIDFNPIPVKSDPIPMGSEGQAQKPDQHETYGWMLFSLNVPVFYRHPNNLSEIKLRVANADITGVVLNEQYQWTLPIQEEIAKIRSLLTAH